MVIERTYTLAPGTYRFTGLLQPTTSPGASLSIRLGGEASRQMSAGAIQKLLQVIRFTGERVPDVSVKSITCGGDFVVSAVGTLEWGFVFEVIADRSVDRLCE